MVAEEPTVLSVGSHAIDSAQTTQRKPYSRSPLIVIRQPTLSSLENQNIRFHTLQGCSDVIVLNCYCVPFLLHCTDYRIRQLFFLSATKELC